MPLLWSCLLFFLLLSQPLEADDVLHHYHKPGLPVNFSHIGDGEPELGVPYRITVEIHSALAVEAWDIQLLAEDGLTLLGAAQRLIEARQFEVWVLLNRYGKHYLNLSAVPGGVSDSRVFQRVVSIPLEVLPVDTRSAHGLLVPDSRIVDVPVKTDSEGDGLPLRIERHVQPDAGDQKNSE